MIVASVGTGLVVAANTDFEANVIQGVEAFGVQLSDDQIDAEVAKAESRWFWRPLFGSLGWPLIFLISAGFFSLMLKLVGSEATAKSTFSTMLHAYWPAKLVSSALLSALVIRHGAVTDMDLVRIFKSSLAGFLAEDASWPLIAFASFVDVFKIWSIVLLAMGFVVVGRVSKGKAWTAALVPWILVAIMSAGLAALPSLFTN